MSPIGDRGVLRSSEGQTGPSVFPYRGMEGMGRGLHGFTPSIGSPIRWAAT